MAIICEESGQMAKPTEDPRVSSVMGCKCVSQGHKRWNDDVHAAHAKVRRDNGPPGFRKQGKVLLLFSGPATTRLNISECLWDLGIEATQVDILNEGMPDQDLLDDSVWLRYSRRLQQNEYVAVFASPPCRTFSEARIVRIGPPVLRDHEHPYAFPKAQGARRGISPQDFKKVREDNLLAGFGVTP